MTNTEIITSIPNIIHIQNNYEPPTLVRTINNLRWWGAVLYLEEFPDEPECVAGTHYNEWTWRLTRTEYDGVYLQNTYYLNELVASNKMNTNFEERKEYIAQYFPHLV